MTVDIKQHHLTVKKTARYYTLTGSNAPPEEILYVFHGYGQTAAEFIKNFIPIMTVKKNMLVVAPEGLSKFYLKGMNKTNPVGASWMTRDDRMNEIEDYINYLEKLHVGFLQDFAGISVSLLGFSQGAATASRWAAYGNIKLRKLLLWAGDFPPDIQVNPDDNPFKNLDSYFIFGDNDPYIDDKTEENVEKVFRKLQACFTSVKFEGKHEINSEALAKIV